MATLTVQSAKREANALTFAAASAGGDDFSNSGSERVLLKNDSVGDVTVTFVTHITVDGLAVADLQITVPAGEMHLLGPFPRSTYNNPSTGRVEMTYSSSTDVSVAVIL